MLLAVIPLALWVVGGIVVAACGAAAMSSSGGDDSYEVKDYRSRSASRKPSERAKKRRQREAKERRRKAELAEARKSLSRSRNRHSNRVSSAKFAVRAGQARVDKLSKIAENLEKICGKGQKNRRSQKIG